MLKNRSWQERINKIKQVKYKCVDGSIILWFTTCLIWFNLKSFFKAEIELKVLSILQENK